MVAVAPLDATEQVHHLDSASHQCRPKRLGQTQPPSSGRTSMPSAHMPTDWPHQTSMGFLASKTSATSTSTRELKERSRRFLIVKKMYGRRYVETELLLDKEELFKPASG